MSVQRKHYDADFKRNAVLLTEEAGRTITNVAENLGISRDLLYRWRREYRAMRGDAFPGRGIESISDQERKIRELEKKLKETEMERDILKKAMAIFSRAPK